MTWLAAAFAFASQTPPRAVVEDLTLDSRILRNNPLKDPTLRHIAVFRPEGSKGEKLPLVVYLPGFGGSSDACLMDRDVWQGIVSTLAAQGRKVVFAVVDGRNHYVCSQYVNSPSSGRYLDYICDEIVPYVERQENCGGSAKNRIVAGHSSGGFGALRLGMARKNLFGGVVALSPDSYFDLTHKPFTVDPTVAAIGLAKIREVMAPQFASIAPLGGSVGYALALCADYAGNANGTFEWLYDAQGKYRPEVYDRWREADPAVVAHRAAHPFAVETRVYLDGAAEDEFKANLGAAKVVGELSEKVKFLTVYYPPGHHSDHLPDRIERGLDWVLGLPTAEIQ